MEQGNIETNNSGCFERNLSKHGKKTASYTFRTYSNRFRTPSDPLPSGWWQEAVANGSEAVENCSKRF